MKIPVTEMADQRFCTLDRIAAMQESLNQNDAQAINFNLVNAESKKCWEDLIGMYGNHYLSGFKYVSENLTPVAGVFDNLVQFESFLQLAKADGVNVDSFLEELHLYRPGILRAAIRGNINELQKLNSNPENQEVRSELLKSLGVYLHLAQQAGMNVTEEISHMFKLQQQELIMRKNLMHEE